MKSPFTQKYFVENRKKLRSAVAADVPIIITANTAVQYSSDAAFPFRQDSNFWYITGIDEPDLVYVHDGTKETLILPKPNAIRDVFDGKIAADALRKTSGIEKIVSYRQGAKLLKNITVKHDTIASQLPATGLQTHFGIAPNPSRKQLINRLRRLRAGLLFTHLGSVFAKMRMTKSKHEIAAIQASIDLTIEAFKRIKRQIEPGLFEYELEATATGLFRSQNAHHAYSPIVASGANACILHYQKNDQLLKAKTGVLIDIGAEAFRGAADITRTFSVGEPRKRLKEVHAAVCELQDYAYTLLKPGITIRDYEKQIEKQMGMALKRLGLIKHTSRKQIRKYFPHATSHFLGIDVHDVADYGAPLAPGMILTVEPGIYIPDESIGVRIEDNVLITESGIDILSKALPREL